jgi:hypothetical protein
MALAAIAWEQLVFDSENEILITTSEQDSQRARLTKKLRRFSELPAGWDYKDGLPGSQAAITSAAEFVLLAASMNLEADVFPNSDGGCAIAFYKGENRVEVSIDPDGRRLSLRVERGIGFRFEDAIAPNDDVRVDTILDHLVRLQMQNEQAIWKLYVSSISDSLIALAGDSATSLLEIQQNQLVLPLRTVEGGSQSSTLLVLARVKE